MRIFGLIGTSLEHSFSERWFNDAFRRDGIHDAVYVNFPLHDIGLLPGLLADNPAIEGFNVTSPYKEAVIPYLDSLSPEAARIGAVNCVVRRLDGKLLGYNTDYHGFRTSLENFLRNSGSAAPGGSPADMAKRKHGEGHYVLAAPGGDRPADSGRTDANVSRDPSDILIYSGLKALVLGSGGAAKAVKYALAELSIPFEGVTSRSGQPGCLRYEELTPAIVASHRLIVNATPLGTYPDVLSAPPFPYEMLSPRHYLYDLIYNPPVTAFLEKGREVGASIKNGLEMLVVQAEKSRELFGV